MCVASKHWELTVGRETSPREHRPHLGTELAPQIPAHFLTLRSHAKSLPSRELPSSFDLLPEIWQTEACLSSALATCCGFYFRYITGQNVAGRTSTFRRQMLEAPINGETVEGLDLDPLKPIPLILHESLNLTTMFLSLQIWFL